MSLDTKKAYSLTSGQVALAYHSTADNTYMPSVQILTMAGGVCISGAEALQALRDAVVFALEGAAA